MSSVRRSARIKSASINDAPSKGMNVNGDETENISENGEMTAGQAGKKSLRKKLKKADPPKNKNDNPQALAKRKRGGKLQNLPDMPLDILFEIFGHLLPYDLLRLSRATKSFRRMLMQRSSASLWRQARSNVSPELPPCPPSLSEPAYANLCFGVDCHVCGAPGATQLDWFLHTRTCKTRGCLESIVGYLQPGTLQALCSKLNIPPEGGLGNKDLDCLPPVHHATLAFKMDELVLVLRSYNGIDNKDERDAWKKTKRAEKVSRKEFSSEADTWYDDWKSQRKKDIKDVKLQRGEAILDRMKAEGWSDVVENLNLMEGREFWQHKLVRQNRNLTDRIWNNIQAEITAFFADLRTRQHDRQIYEVQIQRLAIFKKAFDTYCTALAFDAIVAPLREIIEWEAFQNLILDERLDLIHNESAYHPIFAALPEFTAAWKEKFNQHLFQLLKPSTTEEAAAAADQPLVNATMHFATSLFRCNECQECHLTYTQLLVHECSIAVHLIRGICSDDENAHPSGHGLSTALKEFVDLKRVPRFDTFDLCPHRDRMTALLQSCGLPEDTSISTLKAMNPLIKCFWGVNNGQISDNECLVNWHKMLDITSGNISKAPTVIGYDDLIGKVLIPGEAFDILEDEWSRYGCRHCYTPRPLNFDALKEHLATQHEIELRSAECMEHYIIHPAPLTKFVSHRILYYSDRKPGHSGL